LPHDLTSHYEIQPGSVPEPLALPEGYVRSHLDPFDWRTRCDLAKRITPDATARYDPIEVGRYRQPAIAHAFYPIFLRVQNRTIGRYVFRDAATGDPIARASCSVPKRIAT